MFVLVCYDIARDRTRNRAASILKDYGKRVQYSVFECELDSRLFEGMLRELSGLRMGKGDSVRYYFLCERCLGKTLATRRRDRV